MTVPKTCLDCTDLYHESRKLRNGELYEVQAGVTLANLRAFIEFACGNEHVLSEANAPGLKKLANEFKFRRLAQAVDKMFPPKNGIDFDVLFAKISQVESKQCEIDRIIRALKEEIQLLRQILGEHLASQTQTNRHVRLSLERIDNTIECVPELDMRTMSIDRRLREMEDYFVDQHQNLRSELRAKHEWLAEKTNKAISDYKFQADRTLEDMLRQLKQDNAKAAKALESEMSKQFTDLFEPVSDILAAQGSMYNDVIADVNQLHPRVDSVQRRLNVMAHSMAMDLPRELSAVVITDCRNTGIFRHIQAKVMLSTNAGNERMLPNILNWGNDRVYWSENIRNPHLILSFKDAKVVLTRYDLKTHQPNRGHRGRHLKSWTVSANCDRKWISINSRRGVEYLNGPGKAHGFLVRGHKPSNQIKLEMTDVNNAGTWELVLCGIQLYGWVFE